MGLLSFVKEAGASLFGDDDEPVVAAEETAEGAAPSIEQIRQRALEKRVHASGVIVQNLQLSVDGATARVGGRVADQAAREKVVLALGNVAGISAVDDQLEVEKGKQEDEPGATMYTVVSGDTLGKIAKAHYGKASKYMVIFEANRPLLEDPDKIYPGQVLRIPPLAEDET